MKIQVSNHWPKCSIQNQGSNSPRNLRNCTGFSKFQGVNCLPIRWESFQFKQEPRRYLRCAQFNNCEGKPNTSSVKFLYHRHDHRPPALSSLSAAKDLLLAFASVFCFSPLLLQLLPQNRHPERSSLRILQAAQSKDPDTLYLASTAQTFSPKHYALAFAVVLALAVDKKKKFEKQFYPFLNAFK